MYYPLFKGYNKNTQVKLIKKGVNKMVYATLNDVITGKYIPTEQEMVELIRLLSYNSRKTTRDRLSRLRYIHLKSLKPLGIFNRVVFNGVKVGYDTGQDFNEEIKFLRKEILTQVGL